MNLRWKQLRQIDLNLLVAFAVFAEELSVTAAANRLLLSQSAASRTLDRLRALFEDDLLIRGSKGYSLTPVGVRLQEKLNVLLPKIEGLIGRPQFSAEKEEARFRIAAPDNVATALCPILCRDVLPKAPRVEMTFVSWNLNANAELDQGRLDIALSNDEMLVPRHLQTATLYQERFYCVVWSGSRFAKQKRMSLERYLDAEHIAVSFDDVVQSIPDKRVAAVGRRRRWAMRVPYFGVAMTCVPQTQLVLTVTSSMAQLARANPELRVMEAPVEIAPFSFQAVWHPRLSSDPAHSWLRERLLWASGRLAL
ncbi:LysR family transcriptional regulator [Granulicella sp. 5B5]|uniref:LysR family transcriptional regulator n=1 Tax=Granulicella sp. 5B5 TaxID=1617967 RepID=UPI0015F68D6D|nr:LysR family transcriptional regulator [Granulicella sp. 5B5]QMV18149.1 LysR family transcriptional regulator [Granulicella sp. 5B5]